MPIIQTSFGQQVFSALPGQFAEAFSPRRVTNKFAGGLLRAGLMGFQLPASGETTAKKNARGYPGEVYQIVLAGVGASAAVIGSGVTSANGTKTIGSGVTAGTQATNLLQPERKLTFTFDSSANWTGSAGVVTYINQLGQQVSENIVPALSTTVSTTGLAARFVSLVISGSGGGAGTATIGIAAVSAGTLTIADCAGIVVRQPMKNMVNSSNLYGYPGVPAGTVNAHYVDGDTVPLLEIGDIWVETETAVNDRDPVFVRIAAGAGGSVLGAFRTDADTATAIAVPSARFKRSSPAGVAWASFSAF